MTISLRLLNSDKTTEFTTHNFGNVLAGADSADLLLFVESTGTETAPETEFGVLAVSGNDGNLYAKVCPVTEINASGITTLAGTKSIGTLAVGSYTYKLAVKDEWDYESEPNSNITAAITSDGSEKITLTWNAVAGAFKYVLYASKDAADYLKVGETTLLTMEHQSVASGAPMVAGSKIYKMGTWVAGPLALGDMTAGLKIPVGLQEIIPLGAQAAGNPRQHDIYVSYLSV